MSKPLTFSLILLSLFIGIGIGYYFSPSYEDEKAMSQSMMDLGPADAFVDRRFLRGLVAHHLSAIHLARQAEIHSSRPEIQDLAKKIIELDEADIEVINDWRKAWYNDTQPITSYQQINLGTANENFDLRFLNALIAHHQEAIMVSTDIQTKSTRNEVLTKASGIKQFLGDNLETLLSWRQSWYNL
jgi:uncharacterized protein (DUF305 family)